MINPGILLVDDDTAFRCGIERYLKAKGCTNVRSAESGEAALDLIKMEVPALVLLDLYLPRMNGLKVLKEMLEIDCHIEVFMLTCEEDEVWRTLASRMGAVDYLTKPITLETLYSCVDSRLKGRTPPPAF